MQTNQQIIEAFNKEVQKTASALKIVTRRYDLLNQKLEAMRPVMNEMRALLKEVDNLPK